MWGGGGGSEKISPRRQGGLLQILQKRIDKTGKQESGGKLMLAVGNPRGKKPLPCVEKKNGVEEKVEETEGLDEEHGKVLWGVF